MATGFRLKGRENVPHLLEKAIGFLNLTKDTSRNTPVKAACGDVSALLAIIRVYFLLQLWRVPS